MMAETYATSSIQTRSCNRTPKGDRVLLRGMNSHLATVIVMPMTTSGKQYPSRISVNFEGKDGFIALDHMRSVSKTRLVKQLGTITPVEQKAVLAALLEMFAEE
jgi:mRNA interferase MazF